MAIGIEKTPARLLTFFEQRPKLTFFSILLLVLMLYGYSSSTLRGPYSNHQWRQADCLSITLNYYQNNNKLLQPEMQWTNIDGNSHVMSECPLLYYSVAQVWKFVGKKEWLYRLLTLSFMVVGSFSLFSVYRSREHSLFWSIWGTFFLISSPLIAFYSNNFLMNAPAFWLAVMALSCFSKFYISKQKRHFLLGCLLFFVAGLLKITALLTFIAILPLHLAYILRSESASRTLKWVTLLVPAILAMGIVSWYSFSKAFNAENNYGIFLQGTLPIWELDHSSRAIVFKAMKDVMIPSFLHWSGLCILGFMLLVIMVNLRRSRLFPLLLTSFSLVGILLYLVLFFQVFSAHDYYLTNLTIAIPLITFLFFDTVKRSHPLFLNHWGVKLFAAVFLGFILFDTAIANRMKYDMNDIITANCRSWMDKEEMDLWEWYHFNYANTFLALESLEPELRKIGIEPSDLVISLPDESINISLYLMNQKGCTSYGYMNLGLHKKIDGYIDLGAKYLIINDKGILESQDLSLYTTKPILHHENVTVYQLF